MDEVFEQCSCGAIVAEVNAKPRLPMRGSRQGEVVVAGREAGRFGGWLVMTVMLMAFWLAGLKPLRVRIFSNWRWWSVSCWRIESSMAMRYLDWAGSRSGAKGTVL